MRRRCIFCFMLSVLVLAAGCQSRNETATQTSPKKNPFDPSTILKQPFHGDMKTVTPPDPAPEMIAALKKGKLSIDETRTIGEVFDGYPHGKKKEWRGGLGKDGAYYIDYICTFDPSILSEESISKGIVKRWLTVKFATREGGETYVSLVTRTDLHRDGTVETVPYYPEDRERIVRAIYDRKEIRF